MWQALSLCELVGKLEFCTLKAKRINFVRGNKTATKYSEVCLHLDLLKSMSDCVAALSLCELVEKLIGGIN